MARPFSSKDVKALEQAHEQLRASLLFVTSSEKDLIAAIKAATSPRAMRFRLLIYSFLYHSLKKLYRVRRA